MDYFLCGDFYTKIILVQYLTYGQNRAAKAIALLKEMFAEHGIPETLFSGNSQSMQHLLTFDSLGDCAWDLKSLYHQSKGFA